jgi:hypothetical protein
MRLGGLDIGQKRGPLLGIGPLIYLPTTSVLKSQSYPAILKTIRYSTDQAQRGRGRRGRRGRRASPFAHKQLNRRPRHPAPTQHPAVLRHSRRAPYAWRRRRPAQRIQLARYRPRVHTVHVLLKQLLGPLRARNLVRTGQVPKLGHSSTGHIDPFALPHGQ